MSGTVGASDECATVGPTLTDPVITLAPEQLSTWARTRSASADDPFTPGMTWNPNLMALYAYGEFAPLDLKDLACPSWGLGRSTSDDGTVITTFGPPFLPLIAPPNQALSLDPTWSSICTAIRTDRFQFGSFLIFDPPER